MNYKLSQHVEQEMKRRGISKALVEEVLKNPQQIVEEYGGKRAYQSKIDFGQGKIYLLRVVVDDTMDPVVVITAYRTSKIEKYWRSE